MAHGKGEGGVGARLDAGPFIGELGVIGKVGRDHDDLGALVARFHHEVGVRGAGDRDIRAPHHEVGRVVPVAGFGDVGLVAEGLRRCRGQVGVPVVEGERDAADGLQEAHARAVGNLGHGRDNGKAVDAVRTILADGVDVRGGGDIDGLFIRNADKTALAALGNICLALFWVLLDGAPCQDGVAVLFLFLAEHIYEHAAGIRVAHAGRRVGVPGKGGTARAAAGLVFRHVIAGSGVIHRLRFPGDDAVFDVDLPRARSGAVHTVGGAHHLVEGPAVAIEDICLAAAL